MIAANAHKSFERRTACPQCGSSDFRTVPPSPPEIHQCRRCGLAYRFDPIHPLGIPQPDVDALEAIDISRDDLFARLLADLGTPEPGAVLVDVGANTGYFVEHAARRGWRALGIEFGRPLAAAARDRGRRVIVGDGEAIPLRSGSAAAVTLCDVIDQLEHPGRALSEAARVLRPGGTLWLRARNGRVHRFMRSRRWLPTRLSVLHNNMYAPAALRGILTVAGFRDVRLAVSPTSAGDPYAVVERRSGTLLLRGAKSIWTGLAVALAALSGGRMIISPSVAARATRSGSSPARQEVA